MDSTNDQDEDITSIKATSNKNNHQETDKLEEGNNVKSNITTVIQEDIIILDDNFEEPVNIKKQPAFVILNDDDYIDHK